MPTISEHKRLNYYEILQLNLNDSSTISSDNIKTAYHRALLLHHPDKTKPLAVDSTPPSRNGQSTNYSIDDILRAYQTLSNASSRAAYDEILQDRMDTGLSAAANDKGTHTGVETLDLEELKVDEDTATWYRSCRCGDERGYMVTEEELEKESSHGEIYIGCKGCSLFIRVLFSAADQEGQT